MSFNFDIITHFFGFIDNECFVLAHDDGGFGVVKPVAGSCADLTYSLSVHLVVIDIGMVINHSLHKNADETAASRCVGEGSRIVGCTYKTGITAQLLDGDTVRTSGLDRTLL